MAKPDWITVNPSSGKGTGGFNVTFAENTSTSARSGVVTVKTISGLTHEIQVSQAGKVENYIQGSGPFCEVGVTADAFPSRVSQVTFCTQIVLSDNTTIKAGTLTLPKNESEGFSFGILSLDSDSMSIGSGLSVKQILITCNPGSTPWDVPFRKVTASLENDPGNIVFGPDTGVNYLATFAQPELYTAGFNMETPIPIDGDIMLVYKGDSNNLPGIVFTELQR